MSCNFPYKTYPALRMLFDIIEDNNFGYPFRYSSSLNHGMKMVYICLKVAQIISPIFAIVWPFYDYFSRHSLLAMTVFQLILLTVWTFNLVIGMQQVITISFLLIQHTLFINMHFKNYFVYFKFGVLKLLKKVFKFKKSTRIKSTYAAKMNRFNQMLTSITIQFLKMQDKVKLLNYLLYIATIIVLEFNVFIIVDSSSSAFMRFMVLAEIPFLLCFIFLNLYLMTDLNSNSKSILPELDSCLHRVCWSKKTIVKCKLALAEKRSLVAADCVAVNLGGVNQLTRAVMGLAFMKMLFDIFLIIDFNR